MKIIAYIVKEILALLFPPKPPAPPALKIEASADNYTTLVQHKGEWLVLWVKDGIAKVVARVNDLVAAYYRAMVCPVEAVISDYVWDRIQIQSEMDRCMNTYGA